LIHDPDLLERLGGLPREKFEGECFRATPKSLNPLAPSTRGGRWAPPGEVAVLYMSLARDGALAEIAFHWGQLSPLPSKPAALHHLRVTTRNTLRLVRADLDTLGVSAAAYATINYKQTQAIGAAVAFLGCDGLIVPSVRWDCAHLIVFTDNHDVVQDELTVISTEEVDWISWARDHSLISSSDTNDEQPL
jgi:RES domain-containing protein